VDIPVLEATNPGASLTLNFTGSAIGVIVPAGYDVGFLEYDIDGQYLGTVDQFTFWSAGLHLPWTFVFESEMTNTQHTLILTIGGEKNSRSSGNASRIIRFIVN
jgi:sialidase-1